MDGSGKLVIPYTLDANDMKFCVPPGFGGPDAFYTYLKNSFDVLYQEGVVNLE
jgi:allantoinase